MNKLPWVALVASALATGMVVLLGRAMTKDWPTIWPALTGLATAALVVAAVTGGIVALQQLRHLERTEKIKNTFWIVRQYSTPAGQVPSPMVAYTMLGDLPTSDPKVVAKYDINTARDFVREVMRLWVIIKNYYDEADDLYQRGFVDRDFYLSRNVTIIQDGMDMMRRFRALVPDRFYDEALVARMEAAIQDHENQHPDEQPKS